MNKYVVRQPIKDKKGNLFGYEILFQEEKGSGLYNQTNDYAAADSISNFLAQNNQKIFNDKTTFMTFTPNLLFKNTPKIFKHNDLVIQIEDNVIIHPLATTLIQRFRKEGYVFAINDFQFAPRYFGLMEYLDYIKLDFGKNEAVSLENTVKLAKNFKKTCIAYGIETQKQYDLARDLGVDYFQGQYVAEKVETKANKTDYLQSNFFQLVVEVTKDEPNVEMIEEIISRDAALTYGLLKMVNSVYFALRNRTSSIRQALVTLGLGQLKQWIYLLSFKGDKEFGSEDVLKRSFLRANFSSQLMDYNTTLPISKNEAYLMGMFSTLGSLIDAPLEEIFEDIPISEELKQALVYHKGPCSLLLDLILCYERADWQNITNYADILGIPTNMIAQIYFNCVEEVNRIWETIQETEDDEEMEKATGQHQEIVEDIIGDDLEEELGEDITSMEQGIDEIGEIDEIGDSLDGLDGLDGIEGLDGLDEIEGMDEISGLDEMDSLDGLDGIDEVEELK